MKKWFTHAGTLMVLVVSAVLAQGSNAAPAGKPTDGEPVTCGVQRRMQSAVLHEERTLLIRLPFDYATSDKRYPVLFKLDGGGYIFVQTVGAVGYLADNDHGVPDHIVVGIVNTNRVRDMDPDKGADNFLRFLKDELLPFIDANYRTNGFRILCGQSASSFFTVYSLLREPEAFDGYVLSSFGLAPKGTGRQRLEQELRKAPARTKPRGFLYVAHGKVDTYDPNGARTHNAVLFLDTLSQATSATLRIKQRTYEDEGHVPFPTIYDALRWIYTPDATTAAGKSSPETPR